MKLKLFLVCVLALGSTGCGEFWTGAGVGTAATATFQQWQENLETKKVELANQYDAVLAELRDAPDPNAVALAKEKVAWIQNAQTANEAALFAVDQILQYPERTESGEGPQDIIVTGLISAAVIAFREYQKRKEVGTLSNKYIAMKVGKAKLAAANPEAGRKLHQFIGDERLHLGL